jgi:hypothetical protein
MDAARLPDLSAPALASARTDFVRLFDDETATQALSRLRGEPLGERILYFYVTRRDGTLAGDMVYDAEHAPESPEPLMISPTDVTQRKRFTADQHSEELLVPVFRGGECVYVIPPLAEVRERALAQVASLEPERKRFLNPHVYPVGLEEGLHALRTRLILEARGAE